MFRLSFKFIAVTLLLVMSSSVFAKDRITVAGDPRMFGLGEVPYSRGCTHQLYKQLSGDYRVNMFSRGYATFPTFDDGILNPLQETKPNVASVLQLLLLD